MHNPLFHRLLATSDNLGPLLLRGPVGIIFIAHGAQKLFGWFGGHGLQGTGQWMESIGIAPGVLMAAMAGGAEFFGGIALIIGLLTRPAAAALALAMLVAIFGVHFEQGLFVANNGYEFALTLFAAAASLMVTGAGAASVDRALSDRARFGAVPATLAAAAR